MALNPGQTIISGVVLANVASGVAAGVELGPSATDGELASGSDGYSTVTAEGSASGLSTDESVPSGYAGVRVTGDGEITYEVGETLSPGDVAGIDGGQLRAANSGDTSPNAQFIIGHGGGASGGTDYTSGENAPVYHIE